MIRVGSSLTDTAYEAAVLGGIEAGDFNATFAEIQSQAGDHSAIFRVFADALKMDVEYTDLRGATQQAMGVRIAASARLEQQIADVLGYSLLTSKLAELRYGARGVTIQPDPLGTVAMGTVARMVLESQKMDAAIAAAGGAIDHGVIVGSTGKDWILDNLAVDHPGCAINFGWFFPLGTPNPWQGVPLYPSPGRTALLIQSASWAHNIVHADYSQQVCLVDKKCVVASQEALLADVLTSPTLAALGSYHGPLKVLRQPGVPELVVPPAVRPAPPGAATIALMGVGATIGGVLAGTPGAVVGGALGWAGDAVRRKMLT
jgi:hypothetical protein